MKSILWMVGAVAVTTNKPTMDRSELMKPVIITDDDLQPFQKAEVREKTLDLLRSNAWKPICLCDEWQFAFVLYFVERAYSCQPSVHRIYR